MCSGDCVKDMANARPLECTKASITGGHCIAVRTIADTDFFSENSKSSLNLSNLRTPHKKNSYKIHHVIQCREA